MISTGLKKIDNFLSGGIPNGVLIDIFGENGTGKTQLLLQLSINSIKKGGRVLYFDTTGGFRPERILQIQKNFNSNYGSLEKITVSRVRNTSEQIESIKKIKPGFFSLIVIDNVTDLFSYEYKKLENVSEKNSLFMNYMNNLSKFSVTTKTPIVISNMIRQIDNQEVENMKNAIDNYTHIKIHLSKGNQTFTGKIYWALKSENFSYRINQSGLSDYH